MELTLTNCRKETSAGEGNVKCQHTVDAASDPCIGPEDVEGVQVFW
jgi:hypothetical protein